MLNCLPVLCIVTIVVMLVILMKSTDMLPEISASCLSAAAGTVPFTSSKQPKSHSWLVWICWNF